MNHSQTFLCPNCNQAILSDPSLTHQRIACPHCTHEFTAPSISRFRPKRLLLICLAAVSIPLFIFFTITYNLITYDASDNNGSTYFISHAFNGLIFVAGIAFLIGAYFLPTIIGRKKRNAEAIFILNLLLGWTFLGWVIALVWATTKDSNR